MHVRRGCGVSRQGRSGEVWRYVCTFSARLSACSFARLRSARRGQFGLIRRHSSLSSAFRRSFTSTLHHASRCTRSSPLSSCPPPSTSLPARQDSTMPIGPSPRRVPSARQAPALALHLNPFQAGRQALRRPPSRGL